MPLGLRPRGIPSLLGTLYLIEHSRSLSNPYIVPIINFQSLVRGNNLASYRTLFDFYRQALLKGWMFCAKFPEDIGFLAKQRWNKTAIFGFHCANKTSRCVGKWSGIYYVNICSKNDLFLILPVRAKKFSRKWFIHRESAD